MTLVIVVSVFQTSVLPQTVLKNGLSEPAAVVTDQPAFKSQPVFPLISALLSLMQSPVSLILH